MVTYEGLNRSLHNSAWKSNDKSLVNGLLLFPLVTKKPYSVHIWYSQVWTVDQKLVIINEYITFEHSRFYGLKTFNCSKESNAA